jgi:secreted protein
LKINKLLAGAVILGAAAQLAIHAPIVHADDEKSTLQTLEEEVATLKSNQSSIKIRLANSSEKSLAKAQTLTIQSQLHACEQRLEKAEKNLQKEKERIAEAEHKAEEERKAAEAKAAAEKERKEAIEIGNPVAGHNVPNYTPSSNSYPWGQCTWGVKVLAPWVGDYWGNAAQWTASAASAGFRTGSAPVAGSVIVWNDGGYGHVAYVTDVREDGMIQVLEANHGGSADAADPRGIGNYRGWFNPKGIIGSVSYIYPNN